MKNLNILLFLLISVFTLSCKESEVSEVEDSTFIGKWRLTESYFDNGGGNGDWNPVSEENAKKILEFKTDGRLGGTALEGYVRYTIKDSVTFTVYKQNDEFQNYLFEIKDGKLTIGPAGPIWCVEGCGSRYVKVN